MKKILALALAFGVMSTANAKNEPLKEVSQIVEIPNFEQKKIFDASKIWMAETFKSANAVIQYEDVSTGTIVGKGNMDYPCEGFLKCAAHSNQLIAFTLKIDTKDNKARVTFNDLLMKSKKFTPGTFNSPNGEYEIYTDQENISHGIKVLISEYADYVKKSSSDSNW